MRACVPSGMLLDGRDRRGVHTCVCVCVCVRVVSLIQHATGVRHIVTSFVASGSFTFFDIM